MYDGPVVLGSAMFPRIMLVDSDYSVADFVETSLPAYDVRVSASGRDALSAIDDIRPEIILIDMGLPEMGGLAVLRSIRSRDVYKDIPIIMLSHRPDVMAIREAGRAGAQSVLLKPLSEETLLARLNRVLARSSGASAD